MSEQLTQAEIDALRNAVRTGGVQEAAKVAPQDSSADIKVITYDFRRPKLLSAERMVKLQLVHQTLLKNLQGMFFSMFKIAGESKLNALEQVSYGEYLLSLLAPTYLLSISAEPDIGPMGLELTPPMGQILLDMLLGGNGSAPANAPPHEFSAFEMEIMRTLSDRLMEEIQSAWAPVHEVNFEIGAHGISPEQVQIVTPDTPCLVAVIDLRLNEKDVRMQICYPFNTLQIIFERSEAGREDHTGKRFEIRKKVLGAMQQAPLAVNVELGRARLTAGEVNSLEVGDVIRLDHPVGAPLKLNVGNRLFGTTFVGALRGRLVAGVEQIARPGKPPAAAPMPPAAGRAEPPSAAPKPAPAASPQRPQPTTPPGPARPAVSPPKPGQPPPRPPAPKPPEKPQPDKAKG
jgi:flagellar motor switch protein FliM